MPAAELAAAIQVTRRLALLHPDLAPLPTAGAPPPISPDLGQARLRELGGEHAEERAEFWRRAPVTTDKVPTDADGLIAMEHEL